jgi:hypothetical protein
MNVIHAAQAGQGGPITIACINKATVDLGVPFDKLTTTLQKCYDQHFLPVWGYPVKLYNTKVAKPSDWQFVYFDDADAASALGYHGLTQDGQPISKVFVKTTLADKQLVSVTACHALFEMVVDPIANLWAEAPDGTEYAYEMSDPVEEDTFLVDGIQMSNFVHPSWFEPFKHPPGTKYDHLGLLKKPFSMTKGGYVIVKKKGKVTEFFASKAKEKRFSQEVRLGHRSEYRKPNGLRIKTKPGRRRSRKESLNRTRSASRFPITIAGSDCFALKLSVGKPAVLVNVLLDTGSSMLTVNADPYRRDADKAASNSQLLQGGSFNGVDFLAAVVHTQVGMPADGTTAAVTLPNANLGVIYKVRPFLFGDADGILGLAYPPLNRASLMPADTWETRYTPTQLGLGQPAGNLPPYVDQFAATGFVADKFAFAVGRSVASFADASLNSGVFILGGGEECTDLYTGGFDSVAVVHEAYYHTNLVAVQVGNRTTEVAPTPIGDPAVSNSFIDSGNGALMLDPGLYQQVIALFNAVDPTFGPILQERGRDQAQLDLAAWPTIGFVLQGTSGTHAALGVEPKDYWQFDYPNAGMATARLISGGAPKPGQSILGLPLFAGRYVVFDRSGGAGRSVIKFAARRAPDDASLVA